MDAAEAIWRWKLCHYDWDVIDQPWYELHHLELGERAANWLEADFYNVGALFEWWITENEEAGRID